MLSYPPVWNLLVVHCTGADEKTTEQATQLLADRLAAAIRSSGSRVLLVGPADASIARINDIYRKVVYMKADDYRTLVALKDGLEPFIKDNRQFSEVAVQYDFNPASGF
jgi:primosomal protein N' (replication factor Y)